MVQVVDLSGVRRWHWEKFESLAELDGLYAQQKLRMSWSAEKQCIVAVPL